MGSHAQYLPYRPDRKFLFDVSCGMAQRGAAHVRRWLPAPPDVSAGYREGAAIEDPARDDAYGDKSSVFSCFEAYDILR
jgi:hypothetical protein